MFLSSKSLSRIPQSVVENDFVFIVDSELYRTNRILACFLSPNVCRILAEDSLACEFKINHKDSSKAFPKIMAMLKGEPLELDPRQFASAREIAQELGNSELISLISNKDLPDEKLSLSSSITTVFSDIEHKDSIKMVASNLYCIPENHLMAFSLQAYCKILSSPDLCVTNEDTLFKLICKLCAKDESYQSLFGYVMFEHLSIDCINDFIKMDNIPKTGAIWNAITKRLTLPQINTKPMHKRHTIHIRNVKYIGEPWGGIVDLLREESQGNPMVKNLMRVVASTTGHGRVDQILDRDFMDFWNSNNEPNQWIKFEFMGYSYEPTHYTLKTFNYEPGNNHIKSWVFEGSLNGNDWEIVDERINNSDLNGNGFIFTFDCRQMKKQYKSVRIRHTGKTHNDKDFLVITNIEFFGILKIED